MLVYHIREAFYSGLALHHIYPDVDIQNWLYLAQALAIVDVQDNQWQFVHDKLRETILTDLAEDVRRQQHRVVAGTLEILYPDDASYNEILLEHWQQADDTDKIYHYLLPIVKQKIEIEGAYVTAEELLQAMLDRLPDDDGRGIALWNWLATNAERKGSYNTSRQYALHAQELAQASDDPTGLAYSLNNLGNIAYRQGDYAQTTDFWQQSLTIRQQLGDQRGIAASLNNLALVASTQGNYALANDRFQQSLANFQILDDQWGIAMCLDNLGLVAIYQEDYIRATDFVQQSLTIRREMGDQDGTANNLIHLGEIAYLQGDYERAFHSYQQSFPIGQQLGNLRTTFDSFMGLGWIALKQGDQQASYWFSQAFHTVNILKSTPLILWNIVGFAGVLAQQGQLEHAALLAGFVQDHSSQEKSIFSRYLPEILPQLEAALAPDQLAAALEAGKSLDLETVVNELLAEFAPDDD